jgi:hypothetical protein
MLNGSLRNLYPSLNIIRKLTQRGWCWDRGGHRCMTNAYGVLVETPENVGPIRDPVLDSRITLN